MCVGRDEGLDALDVALVDLVAGVVFQVQIDLFDVGPFWIYKLLNYLVRRFEITKVEKDQLLFWKLKVEVRYF